MNRWGWRPLTFLTRQHLEAAADMPGAVIVAERCGCAGDWVTYRAATLEDVALGAGCVVLTHDEAAEHVGHTPRDPCEHVRRIVAARMASVYS